MNHRTGMLWERGDCKLSIPITWDFSMNPYPMIRRNIFQTLFQFPLLGISPWIRLVLPHPHFDLASFNSHYLGFLHESKSDRYSDDKQECFFQFPLLGISPWIPTNPTNPTNPVVPTFNSHYLGFLHESLCLLCLHCFHHTIFQFPLLGISPWIILLDSKGSLTAFNFQFPLLGISPWIHVIADIKKDPTLQLSIPITWDFSMNPYMWAVIFPRAITTFNSHYLGFLHESYKYLSGHERR